MRCLLLVSFVLAFASPLAAEARGGHYAGSTGSSHKGGHYVNAQTGNHYTHHPK